MFQTQYENSFDIQENREELSLVLVKFDPRVTVGPELLNSQWDWDELPTGVLGTAQYKNV